MTTPSSPPTSGTQNAALTALLQMEYGVVYDLSAAAGQLVTHVPATNATPPAPYGPVLAATSASYDEHRLRRDRLIDALRARSAAIPAPLPAYRITRSDQPLVLLGYLAALAQTTIVGYRAQLAGLTDPALRSDAVAAVVEAARFRTVVLLAAGQDAAGAAPALPG